MDKAANPPRGETAVGATLRLASSLHVKGEISGNEDLVLDGSFEGPIHRDELKLTFGTTAKVVADIIAGEVVVYGKMKGHVRAKGRIEIKT
jgi:cytoskeletal protein CcmA (bactofilin family)